MDRCEVGEGVFTIKIYISVILNQTIHEKFLRTHWATIGV